MTPAELLAWLEFAPAIGVVLVVLVLVVGAGTWVVKRVVPVIRRVNHFLDDVLGEPARAGFDARPGLMERMQAIEHEVTYNHGSSMKDALRRVETKLDDHLASTAPVPLIQNVITTEGT